MMLSDKLVASISLTKEELDNLILALNIAMMKYQEEEERTVEDSIILNTWTILSQALRKTYNELDL